MKTYWQAPDKPRIRKMDGVWLFTFPQENSWAAEKTFPEILLQFLYAMRRYKKNHCIE